ncbi:hypothetical protein [Hydrogenimonas sp.]
MKRWWLGLLLPLTLFALDGRSVYEKKCAGCHKLYIPAEKLMANFLEHNNTLLHLEAPTVNQLAYRLKQQIGDPKGDKEIQLMEVAAFVHDYALAPDRQKSLCMPEVMAHFETMPSLKGKISDEELEAVAAITHSFVPVRVDVSKERLPEGLSWSLTPTFFFLTADGKLVKTVPGAWVKEDFLQILNEAKGALR